MLFLEPAWWYQSKPSWQSSILAPFSYLWGRVATHRMNRPPKISPSLPVICVGNFTAGGTGKTPVSIFLASQLLARGYKPIFLTRGYGGSSQNAHYFDKKNDTSKNVGDEPLLLASVAPVMVAADRKKGIENILKSKDQFNIIIMDDGLQNSSVFKNISIAVVDEHRGFGNERVIPSGPLRAPLDMQLKNVDLIIMNSVMKQKKESSLEFFLKSKFKGAIYNACTEPACDTDWIRGKRVLAYAGIANPDRFYKMLKELGALVIQHQTFPDHHMFTDYEARSLIKKADQERCALITTEKDWVRLTFGDGALSKLKASSKFIPIKLSLKEQQGEELLDTIEFKISSKTSH